MFCIMIFNVMTTYLNYENMNVIVLIRIIISITKNSKSINYILTRLISRLTIITTIDILLK